MLIIVLSNINHCVNIKIRTIKPNQMSEIDVHRGMHVTITCQKEDHSQDVTFIIHENTTLNNL